MGARVSNTDNMSDQWTELKHFSDGEEIVEVKWESADCAEVKMRQDAVQQGDGERLEAARGAAVVFTDASCFLWSLSSRVLIGRRLSVQGVSLLSRIIWFQW